MSDRERRQTRIGAAVAFVAFATVYAWRWTAPLWFDEILYPMAAAAELTWRDTYVLCNGDVWAALLYSWVDVGALSRYAIRAPQSLAMALAGAICVVSAPSRRAALVVFTFWLLYLPVYHYGAEGRQFGVLTAATAVMAAGIVRQRFGMTTAAAALMAATSPYGALCGVFGIVLGHPAVTRTRRLATALPFVLLLAWMGQVFPTMPSLYPDDLRYLILPESRPGYAFSPNTTAIEWLVGSEAALPFALLLAGWLLIAAGSAKSRLLHVALATTVTQIAVLIAKDRVMHVWNLFSWAPLWAMLLGAAVQRSGMLRAAAYAIAAVTVLNAMMFSNFYTYRGPRPLVGIDTDAWLALTAQMPADTRIVLRRSGGSFSTFLPVLSEINRKELFTAPSRLHMSAAVEAGTRRWLRSDQNLRTLESIAPDTQGRWAVFVWDLMADNPCVTQSNPCTAHAAVDGKRSVASTPLRLPPAAIVHRLRGGSIVEFEATAAEVLAFVANQNTHLEYLRENNLKH